MSKKKSPTKKLFFLTILFIIIFFISTQYILPLKNSHGSINYNNIYIVSFEIFLILLFFLLFLTFLIKKKVDFLDIVKIGFIPSVTITSIILLRAFGNLDLLMIIVIPITAIVLYLILNSI